MDAMERREFLGKVGLGAAGGLLAACSELNSEKVTAKPLDIQLPPECDEPVTYFDWFDPAAWPGGQVPGSGASVVITQPITLSASVSVSRLEIQAGGALRFDPNVSVTLESTGNVVVYGFLIMRPASPSVTHTIHFLNVNEGSFQGGGMEVLETDVGLWVVDCGVLRAEGAPRDGWNRTGTSSTWLSQDELFVAPNALADFTTFASFSGGMVPSIVHDGVTYATEVFNVTRNVVIRGDGDGTANPATNQRAHVIFLHCTRRQSVKYTLLRHLGPRVDTDDAVTGRYPLHFHHCADGARGSVVEGVVARDCGGHAFVAHASHGVTFRDTVAFNCYEDAYWWDHDGSGPPTNASHDITYLHCAAFLIKSALAGFHLGQGDRNRCLDCVAAGVQGISIESGFVWPEGAGPGVWEFRDCISHNNKRLGVYVWHNNTRFHTIQDFVSYRNGLSGIHHGAYINSYWYREITLFGNGGTNGTGQLGSVAHSSHAPKRRQIWRNVSMDGTETDTPAMSIGHHVGSGVTVPVLMADCRFRSLGARKVIRVNESGGSQPGLYDFLRARLGEDGHDLEPSDFELLSIHASTIIRVERRDGTAYQLDPATGTAVALTDFAISNEL